MRVNIYIRKEDEDKWNTLVDKPKFIHNALNPLVLKHRQLPKVIKTKEDAQKVVEQITYTKPIKSA